MFKAEWLDIIKKPMMIVVLICIALIPAIYSGVYLSSMWNTYGHENKIPVAVVNSDKAVRFNGQRLNMGNSVVNGLKKSHSLNYQFTTTSVANKGLKDGTFYMVIKVPRDFSANLTTLMTSQPQQLKITYETNRGLNFFAGQVSNGTMTSVKNQISSQITRDYLKNILSGFKTSGQGMATAAAANAKMAQDIQQSMNRPQSDSQEATTISKKMTALFNGNTQTATNLKRSSDQIAKLPVNNKVYAAISQPVTLVHHDVSKTKLNGVGMAPFAICIGLYVGCISISFMYDMYSPKRRPKNAMAWWVSKGSVLLVLSILQAGIGIFTVVSLLGLQSVNLMEMMVMTFATSIAFMSCVFALNVLLGAFGKYLVTILLILQLGGSGGVYPIETANAFTKLTNPYLPMTYGIHGLKEAISIGNGIGHDLSILIMITVVLNIAVILKLALDRKRERFGAMEMEA